MWIFFFKFSAVYYLFFCFFIIFDIFFSISFMCHFSKNSGNFYVLLFNRLEILSKIFGKSWNVFLKNIDIWNPKLFTNSVIYYLLFLLAFLTSFFPTSPNQTCQKILNTFVVLCYTNYWFYQRILKKNFDIFFSILPISGFRKIPKIFVLFYCMDPRFYQKILQNYGFVFKKNLFFYYFWHFIFNFVYMFLWKNSRYFYVLLFYGLEILSKNFGKSWNICLKNIDIWNPKFF